MTQVIQASTNAAQTRETIQIPVTAAAAEQRMIRQEIRDTIRDTVDLIAELKKQNINPVLVKGIALSADMDPKLKAEFEKLAKDSGFVVQGQNQARQLSTYWGKEAPAKTEFCPYYISVMQGSTGPSIEVYRWLGKNNNLIHISTGTNSFKNVLTFLRSDYLHKNALMKKELSSISRENDGIVKLTSTGKAEGLQQLLKQANLSVYCIPSDKGFGVTPYSYNVNKHSKRETSPDAVLINAESPIIRVEGDFDISSARPYIDKYGNKISVDCGPFGTSKLGLSIIPSVNSTDKAITEATPINIDLTKFGLPDLKQAFIYQPTRKLAGKVGVYEVITNQPLDTTLPNSQISKLAAGVRHAEALFGLKEGECVKRFDVSEGFSQPICTPGKEHKLLQIKSSFLKDAELTSPLDFTGTHEATHCINNMFNGRIAGDAFVNVFQDLHADDKRFFDLLNESQFLPGVTRGGHSGDSPSELLSSLISSFSHPDWENKMSSMPADFRLSYGDCLRALQNQLSTLKKIPGDAPYSFDYRR